MREVPMQSRGFTRRRALSTLAGTALMAAPFVRSARGQNLTQVSYQTGWTPEAEHGGLYQALATGIYKEAGLDVDIRKGGPQLNVTALFLANKVDFCEFDSLRMLGLVEESLPGIA